MAHVKEKMTTDVVSVAADAALSEAAQRMAEHDIGDVLVELEDGYGIVTDRDLVVRGLAGDRSLDELCVGDVCTKDVQSVAPEDDLDDVVRQMVAADIRRVPVMEDGRPVGILSLGDLAVMRDEGSVLADISAAPSNN